MFSRKRHCAGSLRTIQCITLLASVALLQKHRIEYDERYLGD